MKNTGDGRRIQRVEKEVQGIVARYLVSGFQSSLPGMITVTSVKMPPDLRAAKVYVSVLVPLGNEDLIKKEPEIQIQMIKELQTRAPEIQNIIAHEMKARFCPKLTFYQDESAEHVLKVERILHDLEAERKAKSTVETYKDAESESEE